MVSTHLSQEADAVAQGMDVGVVVLLQRLWIDTTAVPAVQRPASAGRNAASGAGRGHWQSEGAKGWVPGKGAVIHARLTSLLHCS